MLHDPLVLAGGLDALAALEDIVAARLLHVHVLAGLAGPDRDQRVPVVAGGHRDRVEVLVFQGLADVLVRTWALMPLLLFDARHALGEQPAVGIDQGHDLHPGDRRVGADIAPGRGR